MGREHPHSPVHGRVAESGEAGDLTDIWTAEGWLCLAVVLDLYSRAVIGWAVGPHEPEAHGRAPAPLGRGRQYAATRYQQLLAPHGITPSMSRTGHWDNACVERFFGTLTRELVYHQHDATREEATQDIFEYSEESDAPALDPELEEGQYETKAMASAVLTL